MRTAGTTADQIYAQTIEDGGGTFYADGIPYVGTAGFFVGIGADLAGDGDAFVVPADDRDAALAAIAEVAATVADEPHVYVGTWVDNGALYVECSRWFPTEDAAVNVAADRGELAIYDVANEQTLELQYA